MAKEARNVVRPAATEEGKRKKRREKMAEANKVTFILEGDVRKFVATQARDAGMDVAPYLVKLVEEQIMAAAPAGDRLGDRLRAKRAVLDRAVTLARASVEAGEFDQDFILSVMKKASQDAGFKVLYESAVGAKGDRPARSARAALNQQLGRLIKRAAGARSKRDESGKIMRSQVQDEILTSYTLLEKAA